MTLCVLLVTVTRSARAQGTCSDFANCYYCINADMGGCGWCHDTGTCSSGTVSGPSDGQCRSGGEGAPPEWRWDSCSPPSVDSSSGSSPPAPSPHCGQYRHCGSCTRSYSGECGFCGDTGLCLQGDSDGPLGEATGCQNWEWYPGDCACTKEEEKKRKSGEGKDSEASQV